MRGRNERKEKKRRSPWLGVNGGHDMSMDVYKRPFFLCWTREELLYLVFHFLLGFIYMLKCFETSKHPLCDTVEPFPTALSSRSNWSLSLFKLLDTKSALWTVRDQHDHLNYSVLKKKIKAYYSFINYVCTPIKSFLSLLLVPGNFCLCNGISMENCFQAHTRFGPIYPFALKPSKPLTLITYLKIYKGFSNFTSFSIHTALLVS